MKTAKQIREMMGTKTKSKIVKRVLEFIEKDIIKAADEGDAEEDIYISQRICPQNLVPDVVDKLRENGYEVKSILIPDQRNGDCVRFNVKW